MNQLKAAMCKCGVICGMRYSLRFRRFICFECLDAEIGKAKAVCDAFRREGSLAFDNYSAAENLFIQKRFRNTFRCLHELS